MWLLFTTSVDWILILHLLTLVFGPIMATADFVPFKKHTNRFTGIVTGTFSDDNFPTYETFEFHLRRYASFFDLSTDIQPYNVNYDKARDLFSNTPSGITKRALLHATFAATFLHRPYSTQSGTVASGFEMMNLFHFGKRGGYDRIYDFALTTDGWFRLSEASEMVMRDMASKHSVLAGGKKRVLCAGTMFFIEYSMENNDKYFQMVLTNDSGTYAPRLESVEKLQRDLMNEIPGLDVIVMNESDPAYKELKSKRMYDMGQAFEHAVQRVPLLDSLPDKLPLLNIPNPLKPKPK